MLKSIRQFFQSIFLRPKEADLRHFEAYLNIGEAALFRQFPGFEKVHAILTAKAAQRLAHDKPGIDERQIVRAALLHDIGRISGKISLFDKVWLKLFKYLFYPIYKKLADRGKDPRSGFRKFYIHKYHGEVAEEFLERAGTDRAVIELVIAHAKKPKKDDPLALKILRKADKIG